MTCYFCRASFSEVWDVPNYFDGTLEVYKYGLCTNCNVLQFTGASPSFDLMYDYDYPSLQISDISVLQRMKFNFLRHFGSKSLFKIFFRYPLHEIFYRYSNHNKYCSILDFGCGGGRFLYELHSLGYQNITGYDPFKFQCYPNINISCDYKEIENQRYDLILSHHVCEHLNDPYEHFQQLSRILAQDGLLVVSFPLFSGLIRKYKKFAYTIQAPHHKFLMSLQAAKYLFKQCGFMVVEQVDDFRSASRWSVKSKCWQQLYARDATKLAKLCKGDGCAEVKADVTAWRLNADPANVIFVLKKM